MGEWSRAGLGTLLLALATLGAAAASPMRVCLRSRLGAMSRRSTMGYWGSGV